MSETKTRKARTLKANKEEKYPLQVPISKDIEAKLRELADELDLTLAQYARCVLIKHCKNESTQGLFGANTLTTATVGEQTNVEKVVENLVEEQTTRKAPSKSRVGKGLPLK